MVQSIFVLAASLNDEILSCGGADTRFVDESTTVYVESLACGVYAGNVIFAQNWFLDILVVFDHKLVALKVHVTVLGALLYVCSWQGFECLDNRFSVSERNRVTEVLVLGWELS
jgi:hypothetical protein